jgi:hypothetical protein
MISPRHWLSCVLVLWTAAAHAQESTGSSGSATSGSSAGDSTGASSAFGSPTASPTNQGSSPFGSGPLSPPTPDSTTGFGTTPSQPAATESLTGPVKPLDSGPAAFSISTGYGKAPEVFVSGEGRLARPKFETHVSASVGFDDNIFQTPTKAKAGPDTVFLQQVSEATPDQIVLIPIAKRGIVNGIQPGPQQYREVLVPGTPAEFEEVVIPGTPKPKRQSSAISRESLSFEAQTSTRRTLFTTDFNLNADYYWNRPSKKEEYNGSLAVRYLHRFSGRLQTTASLDVNYLSQPDLSQINTPTNAGNGNYLVTTGKTDLSYRWTPRFSTVGSLSYNRLDYEEKERQVGNYSGFTLGMELRYLWSPKLTVVLEGRYGWITYENSSAVDSSSYYALTGFDLALSRRTAMTLRVGESIRTFEESGKRSSAPYLETSLNYQLNKASVLSWNTRFGFEEPPDDNTEVLVLRSGLSISHFFSPRFRGSLNINGIHRSTSNDQADIDSTENDLQSGISLLYTLTRDWQLNLNYNYTAVFFEQNKDADYFRNSVYAGFDYSF